MSLGGAVRLFEVLLGISLCLQTIEQLRIMALDRVGSWAIQRAEVPDRPLWLKKVLDWLLSEPARYQVLLFVRLLLALCLIVGWLGLAGALALFVIGLVLLIRWRGAFNGGADFMTLVALTALLMAHAIGQVFDSRLGWHAALWYVALQSISSYFISGWVKLMHPGWRSGEALPAFLDTGVYGPLPADSVFRRRWVARGCSWAFTVWEGCSPLALMDARIAVVFCGVAAIFHGLVFWFFGLNRFFWAWAVTFPAIIYAATGG